MMGVTICMWKGPNSLLDLETKRVRTAFEWKSWANVGACAVWDWVSCYCDCLYKKWIARAGAAENSKPCNFHWGRRSSKNGKEEVWI